MRIVCAQLLPPARWLWCQTAYLRRTRQPLRISNCPRWDGAKRTALSPTANVPFRVSAVFWRLPVRPSLTGGLSLKSPSVWAGPMLSLIPQTPASFANSLRKLDLKIMARDCWIFQPKPQRTTAPMTRWSRSNGAEYLPWPPLGIQPRTARHAWFPCAISPETTPVLLFR